MARRKRRKRNKRIIIFYPNFTWILREFYPRDAINFYFRNVTSATDHHLRSPLSLSLSLSTSPGILSLFLSLTHSLTHSLTLSSILCLSSRSLFSMLLVLRLSRSIFRPRSSSTGPKARENRGFVAYATCQASQTLDSTTLSCLFVRKYNNGYVERG